MIRSDILRDISKHPFMTPKGLRNRVQTKGDKKSKYIHRLPGQETCLLDIDQPVLYSTPTVPSHQRRRGHKGVRI